VRSDRLNPAVEACSGTADGTGSSLAGFSTSIVASGETILGLHYILHGHIGWHRFPEGNLISAESGSGVTGEPD